MGAPLFSLNETMTDSVQDPNAPDADALNALSADAPLAPVSTFDLVQHIADGYQFVKLGSEWSVLTPTGETGHGTSPEAALLNIGAVILPDEEGRRSLHRADGSVILLDTGV